VRARAFFTGYVIAVGSTLAILFFSIGLAIDSVTPLRTGGSRFAAPLGLESLTRSCPAIGFDGLNENGETRFDPPAPNGCRPGRAGRQPVSGPSHGRSNQVDSDLALRPGGVF
jgi:hypothetical protein